MKRLIFLIISTALLRMPFTFNETTCMSAATLTAAGGPTARA